MRNTCGMNSTIAALLGSLIGTLGTVAIGVFQARSNRDVARDTAIRESARQFRPSRESGYRDLITAAIKARDYFDRRETWEGFDDNLQMDVALSRFATEQREACRAVEAEAQNCVLLGPASVTRAMNEFSAANSKFKTAVEGIAYVSGEIGELPSERMWEVALSAHQKMSEALTVFMEQAQRALDEGEPRPSLRGLRRRY